MPFWGAYSLTVEAAPQATFGRQEHIYVVCLHCLPPSYSREPLKNSTPLYIILVISLYSKIMKKGKREHIHFLIIRNDLNFTPINFLHHFTIYIYYTKKMHVLYHHESNVELPHPPPIDKAKITCS